MVRDLMSLADAVSSEQSFIRLLQEMAVDRADEQEKELAALSSPYRPGANGWENSSIEAFLEAAAAWARATQDTSSLEATAPNIWRRAAQIIVAGAFYE